MGSSALLLAGGMQAGGSLMQGYQQYQWGKYENEQAKADAAATQGAARLEAQRIRDLGQRERSSARAALAANGIRVDEGVGDMVQTDITQRSEQDALTTILNGGYQAQRIRQEGRVAQQRGRDALAGSVLSAGGQAASAYGGWKKQAG